MNNKQKLEYALKLKKLHEIMVIKNHIYFEHQNANFNRAAYFIDNVMDQHLNEHITNTIDGTISLSNHQEKLDEAISTALTNQRKMVLKKTNRYIDKAVENNINTYGTFLKNRINKEAVSLANKIEEEARKKEYKHLSDTETKKILTEKFQSHGRRRAKNIIRDALHTNQSNISWIHGIQQDYKYKVWMNGRGKGRVRPWHKAKKIQPVHMDEFFDIYGSYHATMMYPGDLNGGAENVANCRCWLKYTNEKPNNFKTRGTFTISNNVDLQPNKTKTKVTTPKQETTAPKHKPRITEKIKTKIQNTVKNIKNKIKITNSPKFLKSKASYLEKYDYESFNSESSNKKEISNNWIQIKDEHLPDYLDSNLKEAIKSFEEEYLKNRNGNEWGQIYNISKNKSYRIVEGTERSVKPLKGKYYGNDKISVLHVHLDGTFLSPNDFINGFYNKNNIKYVFVHTEDCVYIVNFKNKNISLDNLNVFFEEYDKIRSMGNPKQHWMKFNSNKITRKYISVDMVVKNE